MTQLTPVDGDPFAKGGPKLTAVNYDPFAKSEPSFDGGSAVRAVFPDARVTSQHRGPGGAGPASDWHHRSNAAVDLEPIKGMSFDQFTTKLRDAGYPIIQSIDEVNHPSKWSTGPHWHVVVGARPGGPKLTAVEHDPFAGGPKLTPVEGNPFKSPQSASKPPRPQDTRQPANRAQRPENPPLRANRELGLGEALVQGFKNIPHSAVETVKGIGHAVAHPAETIEGLGETVAGGGLAGMDAISRRLSGKDFTTGKKGKEAEARFHEVADPWMKHPYSTLKQHIADDPVGTALVAAPVEGLAVKGAKLGLRGVDAARLASLSPKARAALKAKRVEDAAVAKRYKDISRPIMARHRLDSERAAADLRKHQRVVGNLSPEEQRKLAIAADTGDRTGIAPEHHAALDAVRKVAKEYEAKIQKVYREGGRSIPEFIENYYKHWWDPSTTKGEIDDFLKKRQGSSSSLKHRTIPTLAEGIKAGLKPRFENMLDTMTHYAHQISGHLVNHDLMNAMRKELGGKFVPEKSIPEGMRRVEGMGTSRAGRGISKEIDGEKIHTGNAPPMVFAAKDAAARLYNRRISKGLVETVDEHMGPKAAKAVGVVQTGAHALVSAKLFSAFHPVLIAGKAVGSELGNAIRHVSRGAPVQAAKALAHMPFAPALTFRQGLKMGSRLLKGDAAMTAMDKLYREAGGSVHGGTPYKMIDSPSYVESALRGTFKTDLKRALGEARKAPIRGAMKLAGKALDSENDLIFRYYVPAVKRGAFERELATSLKAHPEWGQAEQVAEARKVFSSIEGRMGLMTRDNMFWSNLAHDIGRATFLSPSWQIGNVRMVEQAAGELPASVKSFFKGKGITQGPAQLAGLLGSFMLGNAVTQYLYTGKPPEDTQDLLAARTGGVNSRDGTPERVMMPSSMKELYEYSQDPTAELGNVLNPSVKAVSELAKNRDWRDDPILHPSNADWQPGDPSRVQEGAGYVAQAVTPIPFGNNPNGENSNVGALGEFMGFRPVGTRWANPQKYEETQRYFANKSMAARRRHQAKDQAAKRKRQ